MTSSAARRWEDARQEMLKRWRRILQKIDARDEGAVLALANMMDEFCEVAVEERKAAADSLDDPAVPVLKFPSDANLSGRCAFCRAFVSMGGCFGPLHALNKAVLDRSWIAARKVAEEHLQRLLALDFDLHQEETIH